MQCSDTPGIIARVSACIHQQGGNIIRLEEHVENQRFFMRLHLNIPGTISDALQSALGQLMEEIGAHFEIHRADHRPRVALLVSREAAFLHDFSLQAAAGKIDIPLVISNKTDLQPTSQSLGLAFEYVPVDADTQKAAEEQMLGMLHTAAVDLVVLARYMKVLSPLMVDAYRGRMINIHHSFLPAFTGNRPYHQARERGVKVIGATAHYVTEELDAGPIITQDVLPISHRERVTDMIEAGHDIERRVLWQAVKAHIEHRVMLDGQRTLVFGG